MLAAAFGVAASTPFAATACGGFFNRRGTKTVTVPSLQVEQVLIVHDPATETEHFVRELVFRDAEEPFGFVVPTPSQPTVAKVDTSPFAALAPHFPPELPDTGRTGSGAGGGKGGPAAPGAAPTVSVLSKERIGSFTVFVLAATDAGALKKWLDDNELATTPASEAWLKHYVDLGFYYAAFRYEVSGKGAPQAKGAPQGSTKSETVRLSFSTPLPYYPYREPEHPRPTSRRPRLLTVWLASPERSVPVAAVKEGDATLWKRPWAELVQHPEPKTTAALGAIVGAQLGALFTAAAPSGTGAAARTWTVQTFQDQKTNRQGWGRGVVRIPPALRRRTNAARAQTRRRSRGGVSVTRGTSRRRPCP